MENPGRPHRLQHLAVAAMFVAVLTTGRVGRAAGDDWPFDRAAAAAPTALASQPLYLAGCPAGDFWTTVSVGGQNFTMLVDSGSTTLAVAGRQCRNCSGISPTYAPSRQARDSGRSTQAEYGDGSGWSGEIYSESVDLPGAGGPVQMNIASITQERSFFLQNECILGQNMGHAYQGIMGIGQAALASPGTDSVMAKMAQGGEMRPNVFSTLLCDRGGLLWLSGYDSSYFNGQVSYTALDRSSPFYAVGLQDIAVGSDSMGYDVNAYGPAVVDTGTTELILPNDIFNSLTSTIESDVTFAQQLGGDNGGYFRSGACSPAASMTRAQLDAALPPLRLTFPGAQGQSFTLDLPASWSYLLFAQDTQGQDYYCAGIAPGSLTILGSAVQRQHTIIFDVGDGQIGFAPHRPCRV